MVGDGAFFGGAHYLGAQYVVRTIGWAVRPSVPRGIFTTLAVLLQSADFDVSVVIEARVTAVWDKRRQKGGFLSLCEFYLRFFIHFVCWFKNCLYFCGVKVEKSSRDSYPTGGLILSTLFCILLMSKCSSS